MKTPCENCTERVVGCHGKCEKYLAYRADIDAKSPQLYADSDVKDYSRKIKLRIALHRVPYNKRGWKKEK